MPSFTLSSNSRKKSTPPQDQQSSQQQQQQYPSAADVMDHRHADSPTYEAAAATIIPAEAKAEVAGRAITVEILPASTNIDATSMHIQEHQLMQQSPLLASSPLPSSSFKFASVMGRRRRQQQEEPSTSSSSQQQQQKSAKSLVNVLLTSGTQSKRNKSHIFKGKDKEDTLMERQQEQEQHQHQREQVSEKVQQFYRAPLPDQWTMTDSSQQTQVSNSSNINNSNNSNMTGLWLHQNCNDLQQQEEESKHEIATTTSTTTTTKTMVMRDKGEGGTVEAMSSGYKEHSLWHQELSTISPIAQQQQGKEWYQHGGEQPMSNLDEAAVAFVSEGIWSKIKKRSGLSSSPFSLPSFFHFKKGSCGLRLRKRLPPPPPVATAGAPSQIIAAHADDNGRVLVSSTDTAKATATTTKLRSKKNKGLFFFSSVLIPATAAAKRKRSHGNLIVDSPLSSPIATMTTTHSTAVLPPRSHSLASFSFSCPPPRPSSFLPNNNTINDNDFYLFPSSPSSSSPNDDTEDVEAQRSRLNAIRSSWHEKFHSPGSPVLIPSSWLTPSHKKVQRSNTTVVVAATTTSNHITKSPSQHTNNTAITTTTSGTTPTNSCRLGSPSGANQNRNSRTSSAFLDQETTRTWRGLFASVRQLSHDTSTTGSSTHSSASTTSLSSSAQSFNEKDQPSKEKPNNQSQQHRHRRRHSEHQNSDDTSAFRAIGPFFARGPSSSSQAHHSTAASLSTIDLEKRAMMMTKSPPRKLTILVVGDGAVGKSALTLRFLRDQFNDEYDPTIEDSYCKHIEVDGQDYTLELTDTAGQSEYRDQWDDHFMRTGDGFICVYSIASISSFQELVGFRDQIWRAKGSRRVPIVITGNKCDLEDGGEREVHTDVGALFAERSNALFVETSAKTGVNIHEMFTELVREIERARVRAGYNYNNINHHNHSSINNNNSRRRHQHHPSTSSSRSRNYPHPPPPPPLGGGSSIRSGSGIGTGIAMHTIGTPTSSTTTKGYSTNVTPPAVNGSTSSSRRRGSRSRAGGPGGSVPVVANMGVDRDVERGICCCTIM